MNPKDATPIPQDATPIPGACSASPTPGPQKKPPWYTSKKYVATSVGWSVLEGVASYHLLVQNGDFGAWATFSLTLFGIALSVYTTANVVQKFVLARASK